MCYHGSLKKEKKFSVVWGMVGVFLSFLLHEVGHLLAYWLLGCSAYIYFDIREVGPVFVTRGCGFDDIYMALYVIIMGPLFSGILLLLCSRVFFEWKIAAFLQLSYIPFEVLAFLLDLEGGDSIISLFLLFIIIFPLTYMFTKNI